jgi:hypothetical protein
LTDAVYHLKSARLAIALPVALSAGTRTHDFTFQGKKQ